MIQGRFSSARWFLLLHLALLVYSCSSIFSKNAAGQTFLSIPFLLLYGGMICVLGVYAVLWQQVLKHLPVTMAYTNKAVTVVWGMLIGSLLFHEQITPKQLAGAAVVMTGCVLYSLADRGEGHSSVEGNNAENDREVKR